MDPNGFGIPARKLRCDGLCNSIILDTFGANCSGSALEINTLDPPLMGGSTKVFDPAHLATKTSLPYSYHSCKLTTEDNFQVSESGAKTTIYNYLSNAHNHGLLKTFVDCNLSQTSPHGHVWPSTVCNDMSNWSLRKINISTEVKNLCPRYWYP